MDQDGIVSQFCELTGSSPEQARQCLEGHDWDLESAVTVYFASQDEGAATPGAEASSSSHPDPEYTGPRTLDGHPAPQSSMRSSTAAGKKPEKKRGLATLGSLGGGTQADDNSSDEHNDDEEKKRGDLFAGGEKSGLAVRDPTKEPAGHKKIVSDLLANARRGSERPEAEAGPSSAARFRGTGMTLGGDGATSRAIPDPHGPPPPRAQQARDAQVLRVSLHIWEDGFSIEDGELRRFDDPQNRADLEMIRSGRAPIHLINVQQNQPVDVRLETHKEPWKQLPKIYKPFGGSGHRLGSPVPGDGNAASSSSAAPAAPPPATSAPMTTTEFQIDPNQPAVNIRIQLPDGARLPARFNTSHTIDDVYQFISRSSNSVSARPWVLATTFPNKDHTDHSLALADVPEFKKNASAVVKWT